MQGWHLIILQPVLNSYEGTKNEGAQSTACTRILYPFANTSEAKKQRSSEHLLNFHA